MVVGHDMDMPGARGKIKVVAQEINLAKLLAGNNKSIRDRGLKKLQQWLTARTQGAYDFTEDDLMRVWKGLFYCMWMSDKFLVQEELAESISHLIHHIAKDDTTILFIHCFFKTMCVEWFGIDQHRFDKFHMLVRRFFRQTLEFCHKSSWDQNVILKLREVFSSTILDASETGTGKVPLGLAMHFIEIYLEELAKVSRGKLEAETMAEFIKPFIKYLAQLKDERVTNHVVKHIFHHLMKQSDEGLEYEEKFRAWKMAGFPGESWKDMECEELPAEEEEDEEEDHASNENDDIPKDPRAGKVDVILPQLPFDASSIAELLLEERRLTFPVKNRNSLKFLADQFISFANGDYPLTVGKNFTRLVTESVVRQRKPLSKAVHRLLKFEEELKSKPRLTNKKKKKLKRKLKQSLSNESEDIKQDEPLTKKKKIDKTKQLDKLNKTVDSEITKGSQKKQQKTDKKIISEESLMKGIYITTTTIKTEQQASEQNSPGSLIQNDQKKQDKIHKDTVQVSSSKKKSKKIAQSLQAADQGKRSKKQITNGDDTVFENSTEKELTRNTDIIIATNKDGEGKVNVSCEDKSTPSRCFNKLAKRRSVISSGQKLGTPSCLTPADSKDDSRVGFPKEADTVKTPVRLKPRRSTKGELSSVPYVSSSTPNTSQQNGSSFHTPPTAKKVNINLKKNKAQDDTEYYEAVKQSPGIPFEPSKKPAQSVLKPSAFSSPINPFYRKTLKKVGRKYALL